LGGQVRIVTFSPADWLMVSEVIDASRLLERVRQHVGEGLMAVVDVSCALKVIEIRGPAAVEVLSKGCGLDLHPQRFPAGRCTRTRLAQLPVIIDCTDPEPRFELYVGRSYVGYLNSWLMDAAAEEGCS
jgi:sarcosine oxidase, subunit gamma